MLRHPLPEERESALARSARGGRPAERRTGGRAPLFLLLFLLLSRPPLSTAQPPPTSARSLEVTSRVEAKLRDELASKNLRWGSPIFLRAFKKEREMEVWVEKDGCYRLLKIFMICTYGPGALGPKTRQGDRQAPEGFYVVTPERMNPSSQYHLAFDLGYPNAYDLAHGGTGSLVMVHGDCYSRGCYAMTDWGIEQIYVLADAALRGGQPFFHVHIFPFRMTRANMEIARDSMWSPFWWNLKVGYDFFERNGHKLPRVEVVGGMYLFEPAGY